MWKPAVDGGQAIGGPQAWPVMSNHGEDHACRRMPCEHYRAYFDVRLDGPADERIRVMVSGEVDLVVAEALGQIIREALGQDGVRVVEVDLSATTFMDASGLRVLLVSRQSARAKGQEMHVYGAAGMVREVFRIAGLLGLLEDESPST